MTVLIVGSTATKYHFPDWREPKDYDAFADKAGYLDSGEHGRADYFWDDRLYQLLDPSEIRYATPDELYTIKVSHSYWELKNGSWNKHMHDIVELKKRGAKLIPEWHDFFYKIWEDEYGKKKVDLTMESDQFFADAVRRKYDHDSLHYSVAYTPGFPIYDEVLKDGKTVQMDMNKVWAMPFEKIVQMFREEVYVTALERLVIPKNYTYSPGAAYQWALRRTITSLTKGKSAQFMVEHFDAFRRPDRDYVRHHLDNKHFLIPLGDK